MKEALKVVGNDALNAGRAGLYVFMCVVSLGCAWKAGVALVEKIDEAFSKKKVEDA